MAGERPDLSYRSPSPWEYKPVLGGINTSESPDYEHWRGPEVALSANDLKLLKDMHIVIEGYETEDRFGDPTQFGK